MITMAIVGLVLMLVFTEPAKQTKRKKENNNGKITESSTTTG